MSLSTAYLEVRYNPGSLEIMARRMAGSLMGIRPTRFFKSSSILPALVYQIIIKMIALKSISQVNGILLNTSFINRTEK